MKERIPREINIREFSEEDLESVCRLIHHVVDICYGDVYPTKALAMYKNFHSCENIKNDAASGYCVVAEKDGELVGTGTLLEDHVRRVYISPQYQKNGIGSMIYRALEERALQNQVPHLGLGASIIAREFWEAQGFLFNREEHVPVEDEKLIFYIMDKDLPVDNPGK
jgi:putative acetyltransferase